MSNENPKKKALAEALRLFPNVPTKQIVEATGVNYSTLRTASHRAGMRKKFHWWNEADTAKLIRVFAEGVPVADIAVALNRTKDGVYGKLRLLHIKDAKAKKAAKKGKGGN